MHGGKRVAWRDEEPRESLSHYLAPLLLAARVIGALPVDRDCTLRLLPLAQTAVLMVVMTSAGVAYSYLSYGVAWNANALTYMGTVLLTIFTTLLVTISNARNAKKLRSAVVKMSLIDDYLWEMGILFKYHRREVYSQMFLRCFVKTVMVAFDWIAYKEDITLPSGQLVIVSLYYSYFVLYNIQHQYTTLMGLLLKHFTLVNREARKHVTKSEFMDRLLAAHYLLMESCDLISSWFSPQLLLICTFVFLVTTLNVSSAFMSLISFLDPYPPQITLFISCVFWIAARIFETFEMVYLSSSIESESRALGQHLSRLIIDKEITDTNPLVKVHLETCPEVSITASNFFRMDNTLFISMLSSMMTYVVIMIQAQPQMKGVVCLLPRASNNTVPAPT